MTDPLMLSASCPHDSAEVVPVISSAGRWLCEVQPKTELAATVAEFIRRRFRLAYGAEPVLRIPDLLALTSSQGSLLAAVGVRNAASGRLFLEDYLSAPVEAVMPVTGIPRRHIAEIAHLAGVEAGVSRFLFASLAVWLEHAGYQWVVCTGTDQLRNSFRRVGIETRVLAEARADRLADGGAGWGRYYDHHPVVMAINVAQSLNALQATGLLRRTRVASEQPETLQQAVGGHYGNIA